MDAYTHCHGRIFETESLGLFKYKCLVNERCFCMCLFLFPSFWIWSQACLSRICKCRRRMAVWLPEQLLSFTVASILNRTGRFKYAIRCCLDKLLHFCGGINVFFWRTQLDPLVEIKVFVFLCSVVDGLNSFVLSINSHLLSSQQPFCYPFLRSDKLVLVW